MILKSSMENWAGNASPPPPLEYPMWNVILVHIMGCQLSNLIGVPGPLACFTCVCISALPHGVSQISDAAKGGRGQILGSKRRVAQKLSILKLGHGDTPSTASIVAGSWGFSMKIAFGLETTPGKWTFSPLNIIHGPCHFRLPTDSGLK